MRRRNVGRMECWKVCAFAVSLSIIPTFQLSAQDTTRTQDTSHIVLPPTRCITAFGRWARSGVPSSCRMGPGRDRPAGDGCDICGVEGRDGDDDAQGAAGSELPQGDSLAEPGPQRQDSAGLARPVDLQSICSRARRRTSRGTCAISLPISKYARSPTHRDHRPAAPHRRAVTPRRSACSIPASAG